MSKTTEESHNSTTKNQEIGKWKNWAKVLRANSSWIVTQKIETILEIIDINNVTKSW